VTDVVNGGRRRRTRGREKWTTRERDTQAREKAKNSHDDAEAP